MLTRLLRATETPAYALTGIRTLGLRANRDQAHRVSVECHVLRFQRRGDPGPSLGPFCTANQGT